MASILKLYNAALIRRPMFTQCATAGFLFGAGDVIAQQGVEKRGWDHDFARTARLTFYGGCFFGPAITKWFQFLNRIKFASPTRAIIYRVWLDQAVLTPAAVAFFFSSMSVLEGKPQEAWPRLEAVIICRTRILLFTNALVIRDDSSSSNSGPTPTIHTITFYMPSPFSETIFGMQYTLTSIATASPIGRTRSDGVEYTTYIEERVLNVPSATTLPPVFQDDPSVTVSPYTSTITGTLVSNGDSWTFETSDNSFLNFTEDCELTDSNAAIQVGDDSTPGLACDRAELTDHIKHNHFLGDRLAVYTLTVAESDIPSPTAPSIIVQSGSTTQTAGSQSNGAVGVFTTVVKFSSLVLVWVLGLVLVGFSVELTMMVELKTEYLCGGVAIIFRLRHKLKLHVSFPSIASRQVAVVGQANPYNRGCTTIFSSTNGLAIRDDSTQSNQPPSSESNPTVQTITFFMPSHLPESIYGPEYTYTSIATVKPIGRTRSDGEDYTMYIEERVLNVPSATTLAPYFPEDTPSVTISPYTSTITGTLVSNGERWTFKTSEGSFLNFTDDCQVTDHNAVLRGPGDRPGINCDRTEYDDPKPILHDNFFGNRLVGYVLTVTDSDFPESTSSISSTSDLIQADPAPTTTQATGSDQPNVNVTLQSDSATQTRSGQSNSGVSGWPSAFVHGSVVLTWMFLVSQWMVLRMF
ncbi:hypothetical protein D9758_014195 [Tetrapyrgos nigripes]|uniref:Uncharacterized protein n=1 Tax=Tetrapyrgos nigripes TaxID=182062 RepID=A0A8H5CK92_9AGAR|nr:hypothetical protein D9758_014195 [Tetrapyrgos nigripes]